MAGSWQPDSAFLGRGGNAPRLEAFDRAFGPTGTVLDLPRRQSVYALDRSQDDQSLALGTRGALVFWVTKADDPVSPTPYSVACCVQGAGVLAVCFVSPSLLAASDTRGRCVLWEQGNVATPRQLVTGGRTVCSLLRLDDSRLVGLSTDGALLFWRPPSERLVRAVAGPPPPVRWALVRMVYWPAAHALVWPAEYGGLGLYRFGEHRSEWTVAHSGGLYALAVLDDDLISIGADDARLRRWRPDSNKPAGDYDAPPDVTGASALCDEEKRLLLVTKSGEARACSLESGDWRLSASVTGWEYRTVLGPGRVSLSTFEAHRREVQAEQLIRTIMGRIDQTGPETNGELHERLVEVGGRRQSLALRVEECRRQQDLDGELRACAQLAGLLSADDPTARDWLAYFAAHLEAMWQLEEAHALYGLILAADPGHEVRQRWSRLAKYVAALRTGRSVIEPGIDLPRLFELATAVDRPVTGRFVVESFEAQSWGDVRLAPAAIVEEYEATLRTSFEETLPPARYEQGQWLTSEQVEEIDLITFPHSGSERVAGPQYGLRVLASGLRTFTTPIVLLDVRELQGAGNSGQRNAQALSVLRWTQSSEAMNMWVTNVDRVVREALGRLMNRATAHRKWS